MRNFVLLALLCCALGRPVLAEEPSSSETKSDPAPVQEVPQEDPPLGWFTFLTKIPGDYVAVANSLFARDQLVPWASVAGSTALLIKYDYELWQPFSKEHAKKGFAFDASEFGWNVGKGGFQFAIAGAFLAYGGLFGSHRALRTCSQILEVVIATGITTQVLKRITGRESPNVATEPRTGKWQWFPNPVKYSKRVSAYDAFPSGHIATTLATTRVIMANYPEQSWIPWVGYPIVGFVGLSMVATNGHWWSDYPLSILLGYHFAKAVTRGNAPYKPESETALRLDPYMPYPESAGVLLTKRF
jgi:membrane-associated phospholipid phosphatase